SDRRGPSRAGLLCLLDLVHGTRGRRPSDVRQAGFNPPFHELSLRRVCASVSLTGPGSAPHCRPIMPRLVPAGRADHIPRRRASSTPRHLQATPVDSLWLDALSDMAASDRPPRIELTEGRGLERRASLAATRTR